MIADIADAHKTLTAREIRIQALMAELITVVRGSTGTSAMLQRIQMALQKESQVFTSVSNVLKTRHDTAKNAINNVR
jgi:hypothetical protein